MLLCEVYILFVLISLLPWKLVKCDWDEGMEVSFLEATLILQMKFGFTVEGCSHADQPAQLLTDLTLTSDIKGAFTVQ